MFSLGSQYAPQIDKTGTIESQFLDGCSSGRSHADHSGEVCAPGEMPGPVFQSWMKKWNEPSAQGIWRFCARMFMSVAALAGKGQIDRIVRASTKARRDVLYDERIGRKQLLAAAILAAPGSSLSYRGSLSG
jgi:hypothetical protein